MLALASLLLLAPLQSSDVVEVILREGDPVPGLAPNSMIRDFFTPRVGRGGGWVTTAWVTDPTISSSSFDVILGQRPGQLDGPVRLLRQPMVVQGLAQVSLTNPSMANGQVAYIDRQFASQRVWVEDLPIATSDEPIAGTAGWTWDYFHQVEVTTSGDVFVFGAASDPGGVSRELVWRWPQGQVEIAEGQALAGFTGSISRFDSYLAVSPNGSHWSIVARRGLGLDRAIVMDGQLLEATPGRPVMTGAAVPPAVAGSFGPAVWNGWQLPAEVNDRGDWAVDGWISTISGTYPSVIARNGRPFQNGNDAMGLTGIGPRGEILYADWFAPGRFLIEEQQVLLPDSGVDVDGDGLADAGYEMCLNSSFGGSVMSPGVDALTLIATDLASMNLCIDKALFRARPMRVDRPICEGVPNSTGKPGQLIAGGSSRVAENEVSLQLFGLPENSAGYALLSRSVGFVAQPGGSEGNLCLGGGIGRMVLSLFVAGVEGRGDVTLDLTALRTASGYVAATAGERWYFQAWYRDTVSGTATSNFTSASAVVLD